MIELQPWLVPLLVMAAIVILTGIAGLGARLRRTNGPKGSDIVERGNRFPRYVFIGGMSVIAAVLLLIAIVTLLYGDELVVRLTAFVTFLSAAASAYIAVAQAFDWRLPGSVRAGADGSHEGKA